ncbi:MAG: hypothetical protein ABR863_11620 [Roseiarcus sp.]
MRKIAVFLGFAALGLGLVSTAYAGSPCVVDPVTNHGGGQLYITLKPGGVALGQSEISAADKTLIPGHGTWRIATPGVAEVRWKEWGETGYFHCK